MAKKTRGKKTKGFRSKFESKVADLLAALGVGYQYEAERLIYTLTKKYISDFTFNNIILEVKGVLLWADREKMAALKAAHPDQRIVFLFMYPHRKVPSLKMTHAEWAEKYGFEWTSLETFEEWWKLNGKNL